MLVKLGRRPSASHDASLTPCEEYPLVIGGLPLQRASKGGALLIFVLNRSIQIVCDM